MALDANLPWFSAAGYLGAGMAAGLILLRLHPHGRGLGSRFVSGTGRMRWGELPFLAVMGVWLGAAGAGEWAAADLAASWLGPAALAPLFPLLGVRPSRLSYAWLLLCVPAAIASAIPWLSYVTFLNGNEHLTQFAYSAATAAVAIAFWCLRATRSPRQHGPSVWATALSLGAPLAIALGACLSGANERVPIELTVPIGALMVGYLAAARRTRWAEVGGSLVDALGDGVLIVDPTGLVLAATKSARALLGELAIPEDGAPWSPPHDIRTVLSQAEDASEFSVLTGPGEARHFEVRSSPMWQRGYPRGTRIATIRDVSDERAMEERLQRLAYVDNLTGLPNRRRFVDLLGERIREAETRGARIALLYLDLDGLKEINDREGHAAGDALLREISKRFRQETSGANGTNGDARLTIGRLGGDEFAILIDPIVGLEDARLAADDLLEVAREPVIFETKTLLSSASIGIALYPDHASDMNALIQCADKALYRAKDQGRDRYAVFDQELADSVARQSQLSRELQIAIDTGALDLYYQPKIDLTTGATIGAEALLRWNNKTLGSVSPVEFVPMAETSTGIIPLGKWVVAETFRQIRTWRQEGRALVPISINVSGLQLADGGLAEFMGRAMQRFEIPPELVEVELTESAHLEEDETTRHSLEEIRSLGIRTALDDFGTGYSSLACLTRIPLDMLKIDRSLVRHIVTDPDARQVLRAVCSLGNGLGLTLVAEGIDDANQVPILQDMGCSIGQGFLYSEAITADEFGATLEVSDTAEDAELAVAEHSPQPECTPYALIVDDEVGAPLGGLELELTRQGLLVLYTRFPDEALLLAQQEPEAIGTVLIAPTTPSEPVRSALQCLRAKGREPGIIVVGKAPNEDRRAKLRELGAQWAAWEPYTPEALANLITMTHGAPIDGERRSQPRLPVSIEASLVPMNRQSELVKIHSLGTGGAFIAMSSPLEVGEKFTIGFRLQGDTIELRGETLYTVTRRSKWQQSHARGIGVRFEGLDADSSSRLVRWEKAESERFCI